MTSTILIQLGQQLLFEIGFLIASLAIFALLGWVVYKRALRNGKIAQDVKYLAFVYPAHKYGAGQLRIDVWMMAASRLLWFPIINVAGILFLTVDFKLFLNGHFGARPPVLATGIPLLAIQLMLNFLLLEFSGYWAHRTLHTQGLLWTTHRAHHSAEVLTFLTGARVHPFEHVMFLLFGVVIGGVGNGLFLYWTGTMPHPALPLAMIALGVFGGVMEKISHSELPLSFGPLDYVFCSARMHQIHHSAEAHHYGRNYGGAMSIFDWMFGTGYRPAADETFRLGLNGEELGVNNPHPTLRSLYMEPFIHIGNALRGKTMLAAPPLGNPHERESGEEVISV
jgi:sterol desaturase/sphingolipid hydroxylase (fatty acid hydroxylase superfamily)